MKIETYACSNCEKKRDADANHWFCLDPAKRPETTARVIARGVAIFPWSDWLAKDVCIHACGRECAQQMIERFLATGAFERQSDGGR